MLGGAPTERNEMGWGQTGSGRDSHARGLRGAGRAPGTGRSLGAINCQALPAVQLATGEAVSAAWGRPSTKAGRDWARDSKGLAGRDQASADTRRGPGHLGRARGGRGLGKAGRLYKRLQRLTRAPNRAAGLVGVLGPEHTGLWGFGEGFLGPGAGVRAGRSRDGRGSDQRAWNGGSGRASPSPAPGYLS